MKKFLALALAVILIAAIMTGCSSGGAVDTIKKSGKLIVATSADFPPFEFIENNNYVGIDMEVAQLIADKLGVTLQIDNLAFEGVLASISSGKCDLGMSAISANPERAESMEFSESYFDTNIRIVVPADNTDVTDLASLSGKKVGVQLGTISDETVSANSDILITRMNKDMESVLELLAGRLDAIVLDESPGKVYVAQNEGKLKMLDTTISEGDSYVIASKKGNTELIKFVNDTIKELKSNGKLDEIFAKYLG